LAAGKFLFCGLPAKSRTTPARFKTTITTKLLFLSVCFRAGLLCRAAQALRTTLTVKIKTLSSTQKKKQISEKLDVSFYSCERQRGGGM
jgi:hypothetical protein